MIGFLLDGIQYQLIRDMLFGYKGADSTIFITTFESTLFSWVVSPAVTALSIISIVNLFTKKMNFMISVVCFIDVGLYVFATSGRSIIYYIVFMVVFMFFRSFNLMSKKVKYIIMSATLLLVASLIFVTFLRRKDVTAVPGVYSSLTVNYSLFSHWVQYVDQNGIMTFGNSFFRGILEGVNFFLGKVSISTPGYWSMQSVFDLIQNSWIEVFPKNWYNAYVSSFFYFYLDFGSLGIVIGCFVHGIVSKIVYMKTKTTKNIFYLLMYLFILQSIISSTMRWQFGMFSSISTIFFLFISTHSRSDMKIHNENKEKLDDNVNNLISIIVPVFNVDRYLVRCLDSIVNQTEKKLEIILIDDGSTDHSGLICDMYNQMDTRIRVIHQSNRGVASARNVGLNNAKGDYIGFVDPDDYIENDMFKDLYFSLLSSKADISICGYSTFGERNVVHSTNDRVLNKEEAITELIRNKNLESFLWNKLFKKELFNDLRFDDGLKYEDYRIMHKIFMKVNTVIQISNVLYNYNVRESSITNIDTIGAYSEYISSMNDRIQDLANTEYQCDAMVSKLIQIRRMTYEIINGNASNGQEISKFMEVASTIYTDADVRTRMSKKERLLTKIFLLNPYLYKKIRNLLAIAGY